VSKIYKKNLLKDFGSNGHGKVLSSNVRDGCESQTPEMNVRRHQIFSNTVRDEGQKLMGFVAEQSTGQMPLRESPM
jgi:hypothetical protein